jgi:hypothetical protein
VDAARNSEGNWLRTDRLCCSAVVASYSGETAEEETKTSMRKTGTIPGSINMPYTEMADRLHELGCEVDFDGYICDTDTVPSLVMFCNGPWCGQSPEAIRRIIAAGYPAEKIRYYRWGMQGWRMLGLTVAGGS